MKRLIWLTFVMLSLLTLSLPGSFAQGDTAKSCQSECNTCATVCDKTTVECKKLGGKHADPAHLAKLSDCVDLCRMSAKMIDRKSELQGKACVLCAEACDACAKSCDTFKDNKQMQKCAAECRKCADACKKMPG